MPQEIEVWYIIPSIRKELAKAMAAKGLKQRKIAALLGITEAAISQYLKHKRAKEVDFMQETIEEIKKSSDRIEENSELLIEEMQRILSLVKKSRTLCLVHSKFSKLPEKCEACLGAI